MRQAGEESRWYNVRGAEAWMWHMGGSAETALGGEGDAPAEESTLRLGPRLHLGERLSTLVPAGVWQTTRVVEGDFVLVSCIVSPAFHPDDFSFPQG